MKTTTNKKEKNIYSLAEYAEKGFDSKTLNDLLKIDIVNYAETMTIRQIVDNLDWFMTNDPLQRNFVWDQNRSSLSILSTLQGVKLGSIKAQSIRTGEKLIRNIIDGLQRFNSLVYFVQNKYKLTGLKLIKAKNGNKISYLNLNGVFFKDLPISLQNKILNTPIEIELYEIGDKTKAELFYRWNNGEPLRESEKRIPFIPKTVLYGLNQLKNLPVVTDSFSNNAINRSNHRDTLIQIMMLLVNNGNVSIGTASINKFIVNADSNMLKDLQAVIKYLDYSYATIPKKKREKGFMTKTRLLALGYVAKTAMQAKLSHKEFGEWIIDFFEYNPSAKTFNEFAQSSTTKKDFVTKRNNLLVDALKHHIEQKRYTTAH